MLRRTRSRRARTPRSLALKLRREGAQVRSYLVADPPEYPQPECFGALRRSRVLEILMEPVRVAGKDRAGWPGVCSVNRGPMSQKSGSSNGAAREGNRSHSRAYREESVVCDFWGLPSRGQKIHCQQQLGGLLKFYARRMNILPIRLLPALFQQPARDSSAFSTGLFCSASSKLRRSSDSTSLKKAATSAGSNRVPHSLRISSTASSNGRATLYGRA